MKKNTVSFLSMAVTAMLITTEVKTSDNNTANFKVMYNPE